MRLTLKGRGFYLLVLSGLLTLGIVEKVTPHQAYSSYFLEKAQRAIEVQQFNKAKNNYLAAIKYDPLQPVFYYELGELLKQEGNYDAAIPFLQKATYLDATHFQAQFALGFCYFQLGFYERAIVNLKEALYISPDYNVCRYYLILALSKLGFWDMVLEQFQMLKEYNGYLLIGGLNPLFKMSSK